MREDPVHEPSDAAGHAVEAAELLTRLRRATMGEYDIFGELGRGGMGSVFVAHDLALDRKVAIKVLDPTRVHGVDAVARFKREARTVAKLAHPNIVPIHAVREVDGLLFLVMKLVSGRALDSMLREVGALPVPVVRMIVRQVGAALSYAHREGVIHRDIKPGNVLIDGDGWVHVVDFGIAKVGESDTLTQTGVVVGTPTYMSPEQCGHGAVTPASDQYALGVMAYELLGGRPPFQGDSTMAVMYQHCHDAPPPLTEARPDCPPGVAAAVHRMLAKAPGERFASIDDAVTALDTESAGPEEPWRSQLVELARTGLAHQLAAEAHTPRSPAAGSRATSVRTRGHRPAWPALLGGVGLVALAALAISNQWGGGERGGAAEGSGAAGQVLPETDGGGSSVPTGSVEAGIAVEPTVGSTVDSAASNPEPATGDSRPLLVLLLPPRASGTLGGWRDSLTAQVQELLIGSRLVRLQPLVRPAAHEEPRELWRAAHAMGAVSAMLPFVESTARGVVAGLRLIQPAFDAPASAAGAMLQEGPCAIVSDTVPAARVGEAVRDVVERLRGAEMQAYDPGMPSGGPANFRRVSGNKRLLPCEALRHDALLQFVLMEVHRSRGDNARARAALDSVAHLDPRFELHLSLPRLQMGAPSPVPAQVQAYVPPDAGAVLHQEALKAQGEYEFDRAIDFFQQAIAAGSPSHGLQLSTAVFGDRPHLALRFADTLLARLREPGAVNTFGAGESYVQWYAAQANLLLGDLPQALVRVDAGLQAMDDTRIRPNLVAIQMQVMIAMRNHARWRQLFTAEIPLGAVAQVRALTRGGDLALAFGDTTFARQLFTEVGSRFDARASEPSAESALIVGVAQANRHLGHLDRADTLFARVEQSGDSVAARHGRLFVAIARGDTATVARIEAWLLEQTKGPVPLRGLMPLARAATLRGDYARATELLGQLFAMGLTRYVLGLPTDSELAPLKSYPPAAAFWRLKN